MRLHHQPPSTVPGRALRLGLARARSQLLPCALSRARSFFLRLALPRAVSLALPLVLFVNCGFLFGPGWLASDEDDQSELSLLALLSSGLAAGVGNAIRTDWSHEAYLKSPNNSNGDSFGLSVAISGDTMVVGANNEASTTTTIINGSDLSATNNAGSDNGAAYVFTRSGTTWSHQAYLKAPNNSSSDQFGTNVSISGDTIVVGAAREASATTTIINGSDLSATNDAGSLNGAAYVFVRSGTAWSHEAYLKAPNNSSDYRFGQSVAVSGDTIVVGSPRESSNTTAIINGADLSATNNAGNLNGAAYVFTRSGTTWSHQAYLKAPNSGSNDNFGESVAVAGDTLVVGASREDGTTTAIINGSNLAAANDAGNSQGAAYVFARSGTTWSHQAYLKAPNTASPQADEFGGSVAVSGNTIVVGARFEDSTTGDIINGSDLSATNNLGNNNGAAYVFTRSGTTWSHEAYLKAPNNANFNFFGQSVAINGDTIVVGANGEDSDTDVVINGSDLSTTNIAGNGNGAAYVFIRAGTTWSFQSYLKAPNSGADDNFGETVAISENTIVVGTRNEDSTSNAIINGSDLSATNDAGSANGVAYVFVR